MDIMHNHKIAQVNDALKIALACVSARFNGCVNIAAKFFEQLRAKIGLQKRLSARKGNATAHCIKHRLLPAQTRGKLGSGIGLPHLTHKILWANVQTPAKGLAIGVLAGNAAKSAIAATRRICPKLGRGREPLGVVAPRTTQRATLKKDRGANTLTIANGKFLYIKNQSVHIKVCTPDGR